MTIKDFTHLANRAGEIKISLSFSLNEKPKKQPIRMKGARNETNQTNKMLNQLNSIGRE